METLYSRLKENPALARVLPMMVVLILTFFQGKFGGESQYWMYLIKTLAGVWLVWLIWPLVREMRWQFSLEAVVCGVIVFGAWVFLDPFYPKFGMDAGNSWNLSPENGDFLGDPVMRWFYASIRIVGSTLMIPMVEEVFYRSFLYRYIHTQEWHSMSLSRFAWKPFLIGSVLFGMTHGAQWLAGILCGMMFQLLVIRRGKLGDSITAHAVANLLLGIWVVTKDDWKFW